MSEGERPVAGVGLSGGDVLVQRDHVEGCAAPFVGKECNCPPERTFVALDVVLRVVGDHAVQKYDPADNARRTLIRRFIRGEAR